jgi:hypothetical protein
MVCCLCAARWQEPYQGTTVGLAVLESRGLFTQEWWRWLGVAVMFFYCVLLNILVLLAQTFLNRALRLPAHPCPARSCPAQAGACTLHAHLFGLACAFCSRLLLGLLMHHATSL